MRTDNKKGFSLVELLAAILVAAIVVLMVGAIGTIAAQSYYGMSNNIGVYNDSQFALQLIREGVRESTTTPKVVGSSELDLVTLNCPILNFVQNGNELDYVHECGGNQEETEAIIQGVQSLNFFPCVGSSCSPSVAGQFVQVTLSGRKYNQNFSFSMNASGRNPWS